MGLLLSPNAQAILTQRCCLRDENNTIVESPEELFLRVARAVAEAEPVDKRQEASEKFFELMASTTFLPNYPTLVNAGARTRQLAACFVLPVPDSMEGILQAQKDMGVIQKTGGGTGFAFSRLRPKEDVVSATSGVSSGPVSFMKMFNSTSEAIKQGGTRRGANMGILRVDHPDIEEFIVCKNEEGVLNNFNISVGITNKFVEAVRQNTDWALINPRTGKVAKTVRAKELFDKIVYSAWLNGEPGFVSLDAINEASPVRGIFEIEATNPCAEQPLPPYDACNLGSINLVRFVKGVGPTATLDWHAFGEAINWGVRFLDDVIDVSAYPLPQISQIAKDFRRIGLGIMGFADALVLMGIPYESSASLEFADKVGAFLSSRSQQASEALAVERGPFPRQGETTLARHAPIRNVTRTTIAPTGTLSLLADCSSGIEPWFSFGYQREVVNVGHITVWQSPLMQVLDTLGVADRSSEQKIREQLPADWKNVLVCAGDISSNHHVQIQASFQKWVDSGVSKTINLSNTATPEEVGQVFLLAFDLGIKGLTVYRDGSREEQLLNKVETKPKAAAKRPRPRSAKLAGTTERAHTGHGTLFLTVNSDEAEKPFEIFSTVGKAGGCDAAYLEGISRLVSLALRSGIELEEVAHQLQGITCCPRWDEGTLVRSVPDAIGQALGKRAGTPTAKAKGGLKMSCPDCGQPIQHQEGCMLCTGCGWSQCS